MSKLIGNMLSNPDALKGLLSSVGDDSPPPAQGELESSVKSVMNLLGRSDDRRITLLNALRPYMSPTKAEGIDRAIRILKLTKLTEVLRNERD
jgi:hypothetical protein